MRSSHPRSYEGVAFVAPETVPYAKTSDHSAVYFVGLALAQMIERTGLRKGDIDGLSVASFSLAPDTVSSLADHFGMELGYLDQLPFGGASGVMAARRAARAIQAGDADLIACIGGDTHAAGSFENLVSNFSRFSRTAAYPYGSGGPNAVFSLMAQSYMRTFSVTREDLGLLCVQQRENGSYYPHALLSERITVSDYLSARQIAGPLHLLDCVMPCAGAEGFLVMTEERAARAGLPYAVLLGAGERHNAFSADTVAFRSGWQKFADRLYAQAGVGPGDVDLVQAYDDYPFVCLMQLEDLGFCEKGGVTEFISRTALTCDGGGLPLNTSGGQLACGQAGAAGGFLGFVEALRQVTGQPLGKAVPGAELALVSGYGMVNYDRGLCTSAAILRGRKT